MKYLKNPAIGTIRHEQANNTLVFTDSKTLKSEVLKPPLDFAYIGSMFSLFSFGRGGQYVFSPEYRMEDIELEHTMQLFKKANKSQLGFEFYASGSIQEVHSLLYLDGMQKPELMRVVYAFSMGNIYRIELTGINEAEFLMMKDDTFGFRVSLRPLKGIVRNNEVIEADSYVLNFENITISETVKETDAFKACYDYLF